jgi:tetratricopeptide (TPR) repeat protein
MTKDLGRDRRTLERAVIMHGTSRYRWEAAATLAKLVREAGGSAGTYALTDTLASGRLAPIHILAGGPPLRWATTLPWSFARRLERTEAAQWRLSIRGADPERLRRLGPLLSLAARRLQAADVYDRPSIPDEALRDGDGRFIALVDALRCVSFTIAWPADIPHVELELRQAVHTLPSSVHPFAYALAESVRDLDRFSGALLALARALERDGRLAPSAATHVILYELALLRCDLDIGLQAAHGAGRTFRKLTHWHEAMRWYELGLRLAGHADDFLFATRLLDGLGNTHRERGAFPAARKCYRDASRLAVVAGDPVEVGNVALGLMTVEREAGRLDVAARIAWRALRTQTDSRQRVNVLLNLGTLLRDGGAIDVAEDTYRLVRHMAMDADVRLMALDALAYCAALRGAAGEYARRRRGTRGIARSAPPYIRAQVGYFRGASLRALGDPRAGRVLRATERYARAHGLREWEVRAGSLAERPASSPAAAAVALRAPDEVRRGIGALLASAAVARGDAD